MKFENPVKKRLIQKENRQIEEVKTQYQNNDQMIPIADIAPEIYQKQNVEIEYIKYPNVGMLTSAPRSMDFSINEVGTRTIKYDNALDSVSKIM